MVAPVACTVAVPAEEVTVNGPASEPAGTLATVGVMVRLGGVGAATGPSD